jgi:hypothetical protein
LLDRARKLMFLFHPPCRLGVMLFSLISGTLPFPEHEEMVGGDAPAPGGAPTEAELEFGEMETSTGALG